MATGDKDLSNHVASGTETGTGSLITVICGFKPRAVWLYNVTGEAVLHWGSKMGDGKGYKGNGLATGSNSTSSVTGTAAAQTFTGESYTPAGSNASSSVSGTAAAQVFTGESYTPAGSVTGKLDLAVAAFSGTGFVTAGQVITTTDTQIMAATDTAAGMWFINTAQVTTVPVLILSNTIVNGASAVLTCQGVPPPTDAGAYKIVTLGAATFAGSAHTLAGTNGTSAVSGTAVAQAFTGNAHTLAGTNGTSAVTGTAAAQTFTGGASDQAFISSGGVTSLYNGFTIGTDTDVNVNAEVIHWVAIK